MNASADRARGAESGGRAYEETAAPFDGYALRVRTYAGAGPPIVLMHGSPTIFTSTTDWFRTSRTARS